MKNQISKIEEIVSVLTPDEQQLLKDTIKEGFWRYAFHSVGTCRTF
jgi:hypothetical protein